MINRGKSLQTAGSVLKHAMCSKREGSEALCGHNPAVLGHHSVAAHAAYPAGQPCTRTIVLALGRTPFIMDFRASFGGRNWYIQGASAGPLGLR